MFSLKLALRPDHPTNFCPLKRNAVPVALLIGAALSVPLHAQNIPWTNAAGGTFNTIANWNSGAGPVPVAANTAQFNIANTYTTTFDLSPTNTSLTIGGSTVSFRPDTVASRTYTISSSASITGGSLTLAAPTSGSNNLAVNIASGLTVNSGRSLTVNAGNDVSCGSFNLATTGTGTGTTTIDGTGSTLTVTGGSALGLNGGVGNLTLQNNASGSFGDINTTNSVAAASGANITVQSGADITSLGSLSLGLGTLAGQISTFSVTGAGSTVVQTGTATMTIGATANSSATLNVSSSGLFITGTGLTTVNKTGLININRGALSVSGDINLNGGTLTHTGGFNWAASKTMTVQAGGAFSLAGLFTTAPASIINVSGIGSQMSITSGGTPDGDTLSVSGGATINVTGGATLSAVGSIDIGSSNNGTLLVDGAGSAINVAGDGNAIGGANAAVTFNNAGIMTIRNSATGSLGELAIGRSGNNGTLNVQTNASLSLGFTTVGSSTITGTRGIINLSGGSITQPGASTLTIGADSDGVGWVNISGGTFTTGTGRLTINPTGVLNLTGGTLNAKDIRTTGIINLSGGVINQPGASTLTIVGGFTSTAQVNISGGTFTAGTTTLSGSRVSISGGTFNANGNLNVNEGHIALTSGGTLSVASGFGTTLGAGSSIDITDASASLGTLTSNGGTINLNSGSLTYGGNLTVGTGGLLGNSLTLDLSRALTLSGTTTINPQRQLSLTGGSLSTGNLVNNGAFNFSSGKLTLTGASGLTVGSGGSFGSSFTLGTGQILAVSNTTTINAGSNFTISGGAFSTLFLTNSGTLALTSGSLSVINTVNNQSTATMIVGDGVYNFAFGITNSGEIKLAGLAPQITGGGNIINNKLIRGDGRIDNNVANSATGELRAEAGKTLLITGSSGTNFGKINLQGGTAQFSRALTNGTTGTITGSGFLYADAGLTNAGQIQLSAGFSSIYGIVTNNNKITVSGGGTATFYNNLTMSAGSTFQTSANSTSVFFGPVTGTGTFTGPGVKNFEGGGPGSLLGAIATITGTTRVGPGTIVQTGSFNEAAVILEGTLLLTPGGNTSRTASLQINPSALLSLTDNDLILDYTTTSPIATLIAYLAAGQLTANGDFNGLPTTLAISEAADLGLTTFNGIAVDDTTVIAKYTYVGDANLDGQVDALDYERIDLAIGNTGVFGTAQGDLNYDGTVDALDYEQIDLNIGNGVGAPLSPVFIPEPTLLAPLALLPLLTARRRR